MAIVKTEYTAPGSKTNAYHIGFRYAIEFSRQPPKWNQMVEAVTAQLGRPNYRYQYGFGRDARVVLHSRYEPARWMAVPKRWSASKDPRLVRWQPHWLLFKTNTDRTVASLLIGEYLT